MWTQTIMLTTSFQKSALIFPTAISVPSWLPTSGWYNFPLNVGHGRPFNQGLCFDYMHRTHGTQKTHPGPGLFRKRCSYVHVHPKAKLSRFICTRYLGCRSLSFQEHSATNKPSRWLFCTVRRPYLINCRRTEELIFLAPSGKVKPLRGGGKVNQRNYKVRVKVARKFS